MELTLTKRSELHLRRYHQERIAYLLTYKNRLERCARSVVPTLKTSLRQFSKPGDIGGYCDTSITDDMISDVYLKFSRGTRAEESNDHLRTLTGMCTILAIVVLDNLGLICVTFALL